MSILDIVCPHIPSWIICTIISMMESLPRDIQLENTLSPCIWKGVSATLQSGRYTLSYPSRRYVVLLFSDTFNVYLLPSPNLSVYGESLLLISDTNLEILDIDDSSKKLVSWPLASLRRYGRDESKFTFESGRWVADCINSWVIEPNFDWELVVALCMLTMMQSCRSLHLTFLLPILPWFVSISYFSH